MTRTPGDDLFTTLHQIDETHRYDTTDWNLVWQAISRLHPVGAAAHTRRF